MIYKLYRVYRCVLYKHNLCKVLAYILFLGKNIEM